MNARFRPFFPLLFCLACFFTADANHTMGGYLSYKCMGGDNYRFTLIMYRDCNGGGSDFDSDFANNAPLVGNVTFYAGSSQTPLQTIELTQPTIALLQQLPGCFPQPSACIERGTYVFDATLPSGNDPIHIVYQRCCRTASITNIIHAEASGTTWVITITPEARALCNSSPVFGPDLMLCALVGEPFSFDHEATDFDGDELTYEFCAPLLGAGNDQLTPEAANGVAPNPDLPPPYAGIVFSDSLYSATQPIIGAPAYTIDPATGLVSGTPTVVGRFVYAVCVNEFRNGQLLSTTRFEFNHDVGLFTATDETASPHELKVFPNPNSGNFSVELPQSAQPRGFEAQLFDLNGQRLASQYSVDGAKLVFSTSGLPAGVYQLLLRNGQEAYHARIVME